MQTVSVPSLTDKLVEELRQTLGSTLGQSINVYRRTRGKTNAGTRYVALAAADGHTLLFADNPTITIFPALNPHPPLDALTDLVPVATFAHMPIAMIASTDHPRPSVSEAIERARRLPGSMNYASAGDGSTSHLTGELFRAMSGAHIVHVNYNGSLPALNAIMTSQVELGFVPLAAALPYLKGGKVRIIAVTNSTRHPLVPAVPTIAESGIDGFDASGWFGVFAPARTPGAIVSLLNYEINRALSEATLQRTLISQGLLPAPGTAGDFRALVEKDRGRWTRLLNPAAIKH
jgi:tripartite-type tricarboxylate transporter receptor subunit TctC